MIIEGTFVFLPQSHPGEGECTSASFVWGCVATGSEN